MSKYFLIDFIDAAYRFMENKMFPVREQKFKKKCSELCIAGAVNKTSPHEAGDGPTAHGRMRSAQGS